MPWFARQRVPMARDSSLQNDKAGHHHKKEKLGLGNTSFEAKRRIQEKEVVSRA